MLGILGLGTFSTIHYIKRLNELALAQNGGFSTQKFKLLNVDFNEINANLPDNFEMLKPLVKEALLDLNEMGVSKIIIPNITIHETIDQIHLSEEIHSKIVHPLKLVKREIQSTKCTNYVVFGTKYTMNSSYVTSFFDSDLIQIKPSTEDQTKLDELRTKVYQHGNSDRIEKELVDLIAKYRNSQTAVLIACTELSITNTLTENVIDLVELQILKGSS